MSLLTYSQFEDQVLLVTDTMVVGGNDDRPAGFRSKVWPLPHMNMVVAMTGTAEIGDIWCNHILSAGATNIEELNEIASSSLQRIQAEVEAHYGPAGTSTIYHFGFPPGADQLVRYTYRSKNDYSPEAYSGYQYLVKPAPPKFKLKQPDSLADIIGLAEHLKLTMRLDSDAAMIGGELFVTQVKNWAQQTYRIHRFDDYEDTLATMREAHEPDNSGHPAPLIPRDETAPISS